jgi:hypothetical protein
VDGQDVGEVGAQLAALHLRGAGRGGRGGAGGEEVGGGHSAWGPVAWVMGAGAWCRSGGPGAARRAHLQRQRRRALARQLCVCELLHPGAPLRLLAVQLARVVALVKGELRVGVVVLGGGVVGDGPLDAEVVAAPARVV